MKYLKMLIVGLASLFIFYLCDHQSVDSCSYYTTNETYYVDTLSKQIKIPIFVYGSDCIFKSSSLDYYLELSDTTIKLKKVKVEDDRILKAFDQNIYTYFVIFELNLEENKRFENAILHIEAPSKSMYLEIGKIITVSNIQIKEIKLDKNDDGIFLCSQYYEAIDNLSFSKIYHDNQNTQTFFIPEKSQIYYYFSFVDEQKELGLYINSDFEILDLNLQEGYYA